MTPEEEKKFKADCIARYVAERTAKQRAVQSEKLLREFQRAYKHWMTKDSSGQKFFTLYDKVCAFFEAEEEHP